MEASAPKLKEKLETTKVAEPESLPAPKETTDLIQEARKYKSAEEFIESQPTFYH